MSRFGAVIPSTSHAKKTVTFQTCGENVSANKDDEKMKNGFLRGNPQNDVITGGIPRGDNSDLRDDVKHVSSRHLHYRGTSNNDSIDDDVGGGRTNEKDSLSISSDRSGNHNNIAKADNRRVMNGEDTPSHRKRHFVIPAPSRKYTTTNPGTLSPIYHLIYDLTSPTSSSPDSISTTTTTTTTAITTTTTDTANASGYAIPSVPSSSSPSLPQSQRHHPPHPHQPQHPPHPHHPPPHHHHHSQVNYAATCANNDNVHTTNPHLGQFLIRDGSGGTQIKSLPLPSPALTSPRPPPCLVPPFSSPSLGPNEVEHSDLKYSKSNNPRGQTKLDGGTTAAAAAHILRDNKIVDWPFSTSLRSPSQCVDNGVTDNRLTNSSSSNSLSTSSAFFSNVNSSRTFNTDCAYPPNSSCDDNVDVNAVNSVNPFLPSGRLALDGCNGDPDFERHGSTQVVAPVSVCLLNDDLHRRPPDATTTISSSATTALGYRNNSCTTSNDDLPPPPPHHHHHQLSHNSNLQQKDNKDSILLHSSYYDHRRPPSNINIDNIQSDEIGNDKRLGRNNVRRVPIEIEKGSSSVNVISTSTTCDKEEEGGFVFSSSSTVNTTCRVNTERVSNSSNSGSGVARSGVIDDEWNSKAIGFDVGICNNNVVSSSQSQSQSQTEITAGGDPRRAVFKREGDSVRLFLVQDQSGPSITPPLLHGEKKGNSNLHGTSTNVNTLSDAKSSVGKGNNNLISQKLKHKLSVLSPGNGVAVSKSVNKKERNKARQAKDNKSNLKGKKSFKSEGQNSATNSLDDKENDDKNKSSPNSISSGSGSGVVGKNIKRSPVNRWEQIHVRTTHHPATSPPLPAAAGLERQITLTIQESFTQSVLSPPTSEQSVPLLTPDVTYSSSGHRAGVVSDSLSRGWGEQRGPISSRDVDPAAAVLKLKPPIKGILVNKETRANYVAGVDKQRTGQVHKQNGVHFLDDTGIPSSSSHFPHSSFASSSPAWTIGSAPNNDNKDDSGVLHYPKPSPRTRREVIDRSKYIIQPRHTPTANTTADQASLLLNQSYDSAIRPLTNSVVRLGNNNNFVNGLGQKTFDENSHHHRLPSGEVQKTGESTSRSIIINNDHDRSVRLQSGHNQPSSDQSRGEGCCTGGGKANITTSNTSLHTLPPPPSSSSYSSFPSVTAAAARGTQCKYDGGNLTNTTTASAYVRGGGNLPGGQRTGDDPLTNHRTTTTIQHGIERSDQSFYPGLSLSRSGGGEFQNPDSNLNLNQNQSRNNIALPPDQACNNGAIIVHNSRDTNRVDLVEHSTSNAGIAVYNGHSSREGKERDNSNSSSNSNSNSWCSDPRQWRFLQPVGFPGQPTVSTTTGIIDDGPPVTVTTGFGDISSGGGGGEIDYYGRDGGEDTDTLKYRAQLKEAGKNSRLRHLYRADNQGLDLTSSDNGRRQGIAATDNTPDNFSSPVLDIHHSSSQDVTDSTRLRHYNSSATEKKVPKITPRQKFEILHNRVSKKVTTSLRPSSHTHLDEDHPSSDYCTPAAGVTSESRQSDYPPSPSRHTATTTAPAPSPGAGGAGGHVEPTTLSYKESPRAKFERDRAARAHAIIITHTDDTNTNNIVSQSQLAQTSGKINKSCDDLDTCTFGYLNSHHTKNRPSEEAATVSISYLDPDYVPRIPPRPAPRKSLDFKNTTNPGIKISTETGGIGSVSKTNSRHNNWINSDNDYDTIEGVIGDNDTSSVNYRAEYNSNSNTYGDNNNNDERSNFRAPYPPLPPKRVSGIISNNKVVNRDVIQHVRSPTAPNSNLDKASSSNSSSEQRNRHNFVLEGPSLLLLQAAALHSSAGGETTRRESEGGGGEGPSRHNNNCVEGTTTTFFSGDHASLSSPSHNIDIAATTPLLSCGGASSGQAGINTRADFPRPRQPPVTAAVVNQSQPSCCTIHKPLGVGVGVSDRQANSCAKGGHRIVQCECEDCISSSCATSSFSDLRTTNNSGVSGDVLLIKQEDDLIDSSSSGGYCRQCACPVGEKCPHQLIVTSSSASCRRLEVPGHLKVSATKKMSPDSVSSSGYESEHTGTANAITFPGKQEVIRYRRSGDNNLAVVDSHRYDVNINNNNGDGAECLTRSTVQELRLRFGHKVGGFLQERDYNQHNRRTHYNYNQCINPELSTSSNQNHPFISSATTTATINANCLSQSTGDVLLSDDKYDTSTSPRPVVCSDTTKHLKHFNPFPSTTNVTNNSSSTNSNNNNNYYHNNNNKNANNNNNNSNDYNYKDSNNSSHSASSRRSSDSQGRGRTVSYRPTGLQKNANQAPSNDKQHNKKLDKVSQSMLGIIHDLNVESSDPTNQNLNHNLQNNHHQIINKPTQGVPPSNPHRRFSASAVQENHHISASNPLYENRNNSIHLQGYNSLLNQQRVVFHGGPVTSQEAAMLASKGLRIYEDTDDYLLPTRQPTSLALGGSAESRVSWEATSYLIVPTVVESFNGGVENRANGGGVDGGLKSTSVLDLLAQRSISDSGAHVHCDGPSINEINNGAHSDGDVCSSDNEYIPMSGKAPTTAMRARAMSVDLICKDTTTTNSSSQANRDTFLSLNENAMNPNVAKVSTRIKRKDRRPSRGYVEWKTCSGWIGGVDMKNMTKRNSRGYVEWDTIWTPASSSKGDGLDDEHVYDVIQDEQASVEEAVVPVVKEVEKKEEAAEIALLDTTTESDVPPALPERTYINRLKQQEGVVAKEEKSRKHQCPHRQHSHQSDQHPSHHHHHHHHSHHSHRHHHRHSNSPSGRHRSHHHNSHHHHNHHHKGSPPSSSSTSSSALPSKLKSSNKPPPEERPPPIPTSPPPSPPPLPPPNPPPPTSDNSQNYAQVSKLKGYTFSHLITSPESAHSHGTSSKSAAIYSENYWHLQPVTSEERMTLWKPGDVLNYIDGLHDSMSPKSRENIYILLNNKKTRAKFSESLEIESKLLSKGLLSTCVSKMEIDARSSSPTDDVIAGNKPSLVDKAIPKIIKRKAKAPVSSTYV